MSKADFSKEQLLAMSPEEYRRIARTGGWLDKDATTGICRGYVQANLAIVPKEFSFDFLLFCHYNPRPFPVIDITEAGDPRPLRVAPDADLRTDLVKYRVFRDGELIDEPSDIVKYWRDDLIGFVIGCGNSFEWAFQAAKIQYRVFGDYISNIQLTRAGPFHGRMVVTPFLFKGGYSATRAVQITSRHLAAHGPPVHYGNPEVIGIEDLMKPTSWTPEIWPVEPPHADEIILYVGCGGGLAEVAKASQIPFMITHRSATMFITDRLIEELAIL